MKCGKKNKYEIGELENVYEEVDEREYTKKVLERQEEDWIVDDGNINFIVANIFLGLLLVTRSSTISSVSKTCFLFVFVWG
jgi:hypothetical protein